MMFNPNKIERLKADFSVEIASRKAEVLKLSPVKSDSRSVSFLNRVFSPRIVSNALIYAGRMRKYVPIFWFKILLFFVEVAGRFYKEQL